MKFIFDPYLVLYLPLYQLDGKSFMSKDAYGHLCTVTGALWRSNGHYFDGIDDKIDCGDGASLSFGTGNLTVEAWCKVSGGASQRTFVNKGVGGGVAPGFWLWLNNSTPTFYLTDGTSDIEARLSLSLDDDAYHHIVGTRVGDTAYLYIDAQLKATDSEAGFGSTDTADNLFIGQRSGGSKYMNGSIGEVRIYNRALNPLEIQHNYLATKWRYR